MIGPGLGKKDVEKGEEATVMKTNEGRTLETGEETGEYEPLRMSRKMRSIRRFMKLSGTSLLVSLNDNYPSWEILWLAITRSSAME
jgi:hypothetical protein